MKHLCFLIFVFVLCSCKSINAIPTVQSSDTTSFIQRSASVDTIYLRDSVFIRELQKGDTVFRDRVEYRDRWRTRIVHDTVVQTDSIVRMVNLPPEKYIPPFYKHCTTILWIILAAAVVYIVVRLKK